jgi:preprotein translocase subunit SecF
VTAREFLLAFRGYHTPHFRIVQRRKTWFALSGVVIALALIGLLVRGLNFSIDFEGGSLIQYPDTAGVSVEDVRGVLAQEPYNRADAEIQIVDGDTIQIRTTALTDLTTIERTQLIDELAAQAGVDSSDVSTQVVGPTWGAEITRQALIGLVVAIIAIVIYVTFRFEWKMAVGALAAMVHDVLVTAGVYALTGREVSPATVIAILTILG